VACCALGAKSVEDEVQVENMRKYELIGMAFQIKEMILFYTDEDR
jgi:hypothetical protein